MPTGRLHLVCGLICAGKSTLCTSLSEQPNTIVLSEDVWLKTLFGPDMQALSDYVTYSKRLHALLIPTSQPSCTAASTWFSISPPTP